MDIGLLQVNWHYHRAALVDPWTALAPYHNLRVGARILYRRYRATGDWWRAVGAYHAPRHAERARWYRARVARWFARIDQSETVG